MFKIIFKLFLSLILCLFITNNVKAFEFVKATENPLNVNSINGYAYQLQHHIFKEGDIYKGVFVINRPPETYYSLGYFESIDGLSWQMKKEILNTGADLSNPSILKTSTGYIMFISRFDNNAIYRIYSSNCDADFNCSPNLLPVIVPDSGNASESNGVFAGHPYQQSGRTYLFFGAWGGDGFKLKLAYSDDLINWQRCPKEFLYGGDGPFPYQENNDLYLFFHRADSTGIKLAKTTWPLSCDSIFVDQGYLLQKDKSYDRNHLIFPSILNINGGLKLYYSGLGEDNKWRLNMANTTLIPVPTLGPEDPTPTIIPKKTIILIPGLLASWNRDAIIHNIDQPQLNWKLNPIVNEYKGIIKTLENLGYEENKDLFVFAYDWRRPVLEIVDDLNNFVTGNKFPTTDFQIVGHSLGGLVGRIYSQKFNNSKINKLITVGSPHYGTSQSYKIVEAGEIDRFNDYLWLAVKMVATINKNNLETDKQTLNRLFPVMKDLFPVYNFLKKDGLEISISDMKVKNELLPYYNVNLTNGTNLTHLTTVAGEKGNTLKGFNVTSQTFIDKLLDNYQDGRPQSSFSEIGDYTVLSSSARINTPVILNLEHGELIYKKTGIKKILDLLNIQYQESQIVEGKGTTIDSSLIFLIKSPATMEVVYNGQTYLEQDGMIFIENARSGDYQLKVNGIGQGNYEIVIGQTGKNSEVWDNVYGETAPSKTDYYNILYNSEAPKSYFITINNVPALFDDLINYLKIDQKNRLVIKRVELEKRFYQINRKSNLKGIKYDIIKNKDFIALEKLENIELKLPHQDCKNYHLSEIKEIENIINKIKKPVNQVVLKEIIKRMDVIGKENSHCNDILFESIRELLKVVKK